MSREISCFWRERERLNIDQVHVPGNKLLWEREGGAEHRPGTCPGK